MPKYSFLGVKIYVTYGWPLMIHDDDSMLGQFSRDFQCLKKKRKLEKNEIQLAKRSQKMKCSIYIFYRNI